MTNAEQFRAMTDEELADAFNDIFYGFSDVPGGCGMCDSDSIQNCRECWLDWLKQEATG